MDEVIKKAYQELKVRKKVKVFTRWTRFIGLNKGKGYDYRFVRLVLNYRTKKNAELELYVFDFLHKLKEKEERARQRHNQRVIEKALLIGITQ